MPPSTETKQFKLSYDSTSCKLAGADAVYALQTQMRPKTAEKKNFPYAQPNPPHDDGHRHNPYGKHQRCKHLGNARQREPAGDIHEQRQEVHRLVHRLQRQFGSGGYTRDRRASGRTSDATRGSPCLSCITTERRTGSLLQVARQLATVRTKSQHKTRKTTPRPQLPRVTPTVSHAGRRLRQCSKPSQRRSCPGYDRTKHGPSRRACMSLPHLAPQCAIKITKSAGIVHTPWNPNAFPPPRQPNCCPPPPLFLRIRGS